MVPEMETMEEETEDKQQEEKMREDDMVLRIAIEEEEAEEMHIKVEMKEGNEEETPKDDEEEWLIQTKKKQLQSKRKRDNNGERRWVEALEKIGEVLSRDTKPKPRVGEEDTTQALILQLTAQVSKLAEELDTLRCHNLNRNERRGRRNRGTNAKCYRCDEVGHLSRECTKMLQCSYCHKMGHVESTCWRKPGATGPRKRPQNDGGGGRTIQPRV